LVGVGQLNRIIDRYEDIFGTDINEQLYVATIMEENLRIKQLILDTTDVIA
jgi:hypothetical protein